MTQPRPRITRRLTRELDPAPRPFTPKETERRDRIRTLGLVLLVKHGIHALRFPTFCYALGYTPSMVRKHFCDLDELLLDILQEHAGRLTNTINAVPQDAPNRRQAQRAAYAATTRPSRGGFTDTHLLLVRDRHLLPPEELNPIEASLAQLGQTLGGSQGAEILSLLDNPFFTLGQIEAMLETLFPPRLERQTPNTRPAAPLPRPTILH